MLPKVLPVGGAAVAFVIMPFGPVFDQIYDRLFVPLLRGAGYQVRRADTLLNQRAIMREVIEGIDRAELVFADLTGGNANVFYELGIAHALRKKTVLVAQRRDEIPFDLRGYKNHIYRLDFASPPRLVDDLRDELGPFLAAARKDEVLFGSPFSDFSTLPPDENEPVEAGGLLDDLRDFVRGSNNYSVALAEAGAIASELGARQQELNELITAVPDGVDPLDHALNVISDVASLWERTSGRLERLLDESLAPLTLTIERGAKAAHRITRLDPSGAKADAFLKSLRELAATAGQSAEQQAQLASVVREQSMIAGVLRAPGARLASVLERYATIFERIASLAAIDIPAS